MATLRVGLPPSSFMPYHHGCAKSGLTPTRRCPVTGIGPEVLGFLLDVLKTPYEIVIINSTSVGTLQQNGTWTGMLGDVHRNNVDVMADLFIIEETAMSSFVMSLPIMDDELSILAPKAELGTDWRFSAFDSRPIDPYSYDLWLAIALVMLLSTAIRTLAQCWRTTTTIKLATMLVATGSVVFMGLYRGLLLAHLLKPLTKTPYNTLEKLADGMRYDNLKLLRYSGDDIWYIQKLLSNEKYQKFQEALNEKDASIFIENYDSRLSKLLCVGVNYRSDAISHGNGFLINTATFNEFATHSYCNTQFYKLDIGEGSGRAAFHFHKPSIKSQNYNKTQKFIQLLDEAIVNHQETIQSIVGRNVERRGGIVPSYHIPTCTLPVDVNHLSVGRKAFTLADMKTIIMAFSVTSASAILIFVVEILWNIMLALTFQN